MREKFKDWNPWPKTLKLIEHANTIIEEYQERGFKLTVRGLFYQFVARGLIENTFLKYKTFSISIADAREAGMIDWDAIEDRTRELNRHSTWSSPGDIIRGAARAYQTDLWKDQPYRPEVWIEKEALLGVIEDVCDEFRLPSFAIRGNVSLSAVYHEAKRLARVFHRGQTPVIIYLGDHDPNGIDITRDLTAKLNLYARQPIDVRRIALTMEQIEEHNPPPSFVKEGDPRTSGYLEQFGTDECWELDALPPDIIDALIRDEIESMIVRSRWNKARAQERRGCKLLETAADRWSDVEKHLAAKAGTTKRK
jgi:hypothetical protein